MPKGGAAINRARIHEELLVPSKEEGLYRRLMYWWRRWRYPFGIRVRLAVAIVLTAAIPVAGAVILARSLVQQASERAFVPEIRTHLDGALATYGELARQTKQVMRLQARHLASDDSLRLAATKGDARQLQHLLENAVVSSPSVAALAVLDEDAELLAQARRSQAPNAQQELSLEVDVELLPLAVTAEGEAADGVGRALTLRAQMVVDKAPFDKFSHLGEFIEAYSSLARRRDVDERTYVLAFAVLLLGSIMIAVTVGSWLARSISTRIGALAEAATEVGRGDLSVRVAEEPKDEVGQLGLAFNQMLTEVEASRSRIEYLSRLASWQEMARRLAHEIKNPLTPIQLAVQEVHQRFRNLPAKDREILDLALEIVEAEVLTLRRLVKEFSEFARLPQSERQPMPLGDFLRELQSELRLPLQSLSLEGDDYPTLALIWEVSDEPMSVRLDPQMMRRALFNLIRNAVQASRGREQVRIWVRAIPQRGYLVQVEDDGPGIQPDVRERIFEPYVTTKDDGTGLGLAIVKKIVMDHEGSIVVAIGAAGGALFSIRLPPAPSER